MKMLTRKKLVISGICVALLLPLIPMCHYFGDNVPVLGKVYEYLYVKYLQARYADRIDGWITRIDNERKSGKIAPSLTYVPPISGNYDIVVKRFDDFPDLSYDVVFFIITSNLWAERGYFYSPSGELPLRGVVQPEIMYTSDLGGNWYYYVAS